MYLRNPTAPSSMRLAQKRLTLAVGPIGLELKLPDAASFVAVERRYRGFCNPELLEEAAAAPFELAIALGDARTAEASDYSVLAQSKGQKLWLESGAVKAILDFEAQQGRVTIQPDPRFGLGVHLENTLRPIAQRLLLDRDAFLVHAAALVAPESAEAALFPAPSGFGKTTLSRRLESSGLHLVSDDLVLVDLSAAGPAVRLAPFFGTIPPRLEKRGPWPLTSIDFLRRSPIGRSAPMPIPEAAAELIANVPFCENLDPARRQRLIDLTRRVSQAAPARRFRADLNATDESTLSYASN